MIKSSKPWETINPVYQTFEKVNLMKPKNDSDPWNSTATAIESKGWQ